MSKFNGKVQYLTSFASAVHVTLKTFTALFMIHTLAVVTFLTCIESVRLVALSFNTKFCIQCSPGKVYVGIVTFFNFL